MQRVIIGMTVVTTIALGAIIVAQDRPQTGSFEVVSIRAVPDGSPPIRMSQLLRIDARGRLVGRADLRSVIHLAYGLEPYERIITANPASSHLLDEHFEIMALPPEAVPPRNNDDVKAMARRMLGERFALRIRTDTELINATVLRVIKPGVTGPSVKRADEGCVPLPADARPGVPKFAEAYLRSCILTYFENRIRGTVTFARFASYASSSAGRPILDGTGLEGLFTIDVVVSPASYLYLPFGNSNSARRDSNEQNDAPAFADALRDQMGLASRSERQPVRQLVVEHVERFIEN
jgi:uncharacterized protein (TIGR03435 family)